jgi:hypothetical protein
MIYVKKTKKNILLQINRKKKTTVRNRDKEKIHLFVYISFFVDKYVTFFFGTNKTKEEKKSMYLYGKFLSQVDPLLFFLLKAHRLLFFSHVPEMSCWPEIFVFFCVWLSPDSFIASRFFFFCAYHFLLKMKENSLPAAFVGCSSFILFILFFLP